LPRLFTAPLLTHRTAPSRCTPTRRRPPCAQALVGYDGDVFFTIVANGTIHAIMYTYYLLTLFDIRPS
jgi:hypothetical protein